MTPEPFSDGSKARANPNLFRGFSKPKGKFCGTSSDMLALLWQVTNFPTSRRSRHMSRIVRQSFFLFGIKVGGGGLTEGLETLGELYCGDSHDWRVNSQAVHNKICDSLGSRETPGEVPNWVRVRGLPQARKKVKRVSPDHLDANSLADMHTQLHKTLEPKKRKQVTGDNNAELQVSDLSYSVHPYNPVLIT